ncbi:MAG: hypothetical protein H7841_10050 [Magnetospirillum sp. WYHS-4]
MKTVLKLDEIEVRIADLDRKIIQLKEERDRRIKERASTRRRLAIDRKIVCGAVVLDLAAKEERFRRVLVNILNGELKDPLIRRLFADLLERQANDNLPEFTEEPKPTTVENIHG